MTAPESPDAQPLVTVEPRAVAVVPHGDTYGLLTLIRRDAGRTRDGHMLSLWECTCGSRVTMAYSRVKFRRAPSCGCAARLASSVRATTHGGKNSREYGPWLAMRRRCDMPNDKDYPRYGGRGVTVCDSWRVSFAQFLADVGPRPPGTTLDRIDNRGHYEPGNVRWAPPQVQARNRSNTFVWNIKGRQFGSCAEAAVAFGVSEHTVWRWVNGAFDKRRGTATPPRGDCSIAERYPQT